MNIEEMVQAKIAYALQVAEQQSSVGWFLLAFGGVCVAVAIFLAVINQSSFSDYDILIFLSIICAAIGVIFGGGLLLDAHFTKKNAEAKARAAIAEYRLVDVREGKR